MSTQIRFLLAAVPAFIIGLAFGLGKILRDCSIICNVGYQLTPLAILAVGIVAIPISSLTLRIGSRLGYKRWQITTLVVIAASFLVFWASSYFILTKLSETTNPGSADSLWTFPLGFLYVCFFIWLGAIGAAVKPNLKSTVYRLFPHRDREKALAITTAAVIAGGFIGAGSITLLGPHILSKYDMRYELFRDSSLVIMALIVLLIIPFILIIARITKDKPLKIEDHQELDAMVPALDRANLRSTLQIITKSPKLKRMSTLIVVTGIAETIMIFLFYWFANDQVPILNGRGMFFANFYIWLNSWTLLFLLFGTNRLINRFGLIAALVSMPVALFFSSTYLIVQTAMVAMFVLRITYSSLEQSLYGQGLDRLILEVDEKHASLVRPVLHGLAIRLGRGLGAILVIILVLGAGISFTYMTVVFMLILFFWLGIALSMRPYIHKPSLLSPRVPPLSVTE